MRGAPRARVHWLFDQGLDRTRTEEPAESEPSLAVFSVELSFCTPEPRIAKPIPRRQW